MFENIERLGIFYKYLVTLSDYANWIILINIMKFYTLASLVLKCLPYKDALFLGFHQNIELRTSKREFADIIHQNKQGFEGKKLSEGQVGRNSLRFSNMCCRLRRIGDRHVRKIQTVFLPRFSCLFCLLSSRILQNNFLDLYLVEIRRYKLSFFAKAATNTSRVGSPFF